MKNKKPVILIGTINKNRSGAISIIAIAFVQELRTKYNFVLHFANRKYGFTSHAKINILNLYYFIKHLTMWVYKLIYFKPDIAHYPITSYWNFEKSILFLKIAKLFGSKTIGHLHGGGFDKFWVSLSKKRKSIAIKEIKKLDILVVLSKSWKEWVCRNLGLKYKKVMVVNNPIERDFELNAINFRVLKTPRIFFIGAMGKRKGVYDILDVADLLKKKQINILISLAGPEDKKGDLKHINSIIKKNNLNNVRIYKPLYDYEKNEFFKKNTIFLFPSYSENFPLVLIEAAAAGKAIITTKVGALPEFFENDKSVIFIQPGNIEQITDAIIDLVNDNRKIIRLGNNARKVFINKLSRKNISTSLDYVYKSILNIK